MHYFNTGVKTLLLSFIYAIAAVSVSAEGWR